MGAPGIVVEVENDDLCLFLHAHEAALRKCSHPYKIVAGATKINVFYISSALPAIKKTIQNRSRSLSNRASHKDRAKNRSENSPCSVWDGSGAILGGSGPALGRFCMSLGLSWPLAGLSRARLGPSWASLWRLMGALWRPGALRALILGGWGLCRAEFWRSSGARFACFLLRLVAMDASARTTMKGAATCDKRCDLQNSVNQQNPERILRLRAIPESMPVSESPLYPAPFTLEASGVDFAVPGLDSGASRPRFWSLRALVLEGSCKCDCHVRLAMAGFICAVTMNLH